MAVEMAVEKENQVAQHLGKMRCKCGHELGEVSFPLDSNYIHAKNICVWTCCSLSWESCSCKKTVPTPTPVKARRALSEIEDVEKGDELCGHEPVGKPPDDVDVLFTIRDRYGELRSYITKEGTCVNNRQQVIGFINFLEGTAGSIDEEYLGQCIDQLSGDECVVEDALDERCGSVNLGSSRIFSNSGSTIAEIDGSGVIVGNHGSKLGEFEGFSYTDLRCVALYLMLVDPGMLNEMEG
jgi:hypothetical protein